MTIADQANNDWRIAGFGDFCGLIVARNEQWIVTLAGVERDLFYLLKTIEKVNAHEQEIEDVDPGCGWLEYE